MTRVKLPRTATIGDFTQRTTLLAAPGELLRTNDGCVAPPTGQVNTSNEIGRNF